MPKTIPSLDRSLFLRQSGEFAGEFTVIEMLYGEAAPKEYSIGDYLEVALESPMFVTDRTFRDTDGQDKPIAQFKIAVMFSAVSEVLRVNIRTPIGLFSRRYQQGLRMGQCHILTSVKLTMDGQVWYLPEIDKERGTEG